MEYFELEYLSIQQWQQMSMNQSKIEWFAEGQNIHYSH